jgi:hypothetical protein
VIAAYHPIPAIMAIAVVAGIVLGVAAKTTRAPVQKPAKTAVHFGAETRSAKILPNVTPAPVTAGGFGARWPSIDLTLEAAEPLRPPEDSVGIPKSAEASRPPSGSEARTPEGAPHRATNICEAHGRRKVWLSRRTWRCLK